MAQMTREAILQLLRSPGGAAEWNRRRDPSEWLPDLAGADLSRAALHRVNLLGAGLAGANLASAQLSYSDLRESILSGADLSGANLFEANLSCADIRHADLRNCALDFANLNGARLHGANLAGCRLQRTSLIDVDLSSVTGLDSVWFFGACQLGLETFAKSRGRIPAAFLLDCGLSQWEAALAALYADGLDATQLRTRLNAVQHLLVEIGHIFLSYSHKDRIPVGKIHEQLLSDSRGVWLDTRDGVSGSVERQIGDAIHGAEVVLLVLSENSIASEWVQQELAMVQKIETEQRRDILCPVALDDTWKATSSSEWQFARSKVVIDFSQWRIDNAFRDSMRRLINGLAKYYALTGPRRP